MLLAVFGFIVLRGLLRLMAEQDLFVVLASCGLVTSFGLQAFVNMASTLHLIPTKGMTCPSCPMAVRRCWRWRSAWACCWR